MSRNQFLYILKVLHIVPKTSVVHDKKDPKYDSISQVRWMLEHMIRAFQSLWNPSPYLYVDEMMVAYNGKFCSFTQYLLLKPVTHGIKIWYLACSATKFVLNLEVYIGVANESIQGLPSYSCRSGVGVVTRLTTGWKGMWYTVVMDNFFTFPLLFEDMLYRGFYATGTTLQKRVEFPSNLKIPNKRSRGSLHVRMHRDRHMVAMHWLDTKGVSFLSTSSNPV